MKVLFIGNLSFGSTSLQMYTAFSELDITLEVVDTELFFSYPRTLTERIAFKLRGNQPPADCIRALHNEIIKMSKEVNPDLCYFYHFRYILPETLQQLKEQGAKVYCFLLDDMFNPENQTFTFFDAIKLVDCVFTTKSYNVAEFRALGVSEAVFVNNAYSPTCHYSVELSEKEQKIYGGDVTFVGTFRPERVDFLAEVIKQHPDVHFNIWGGGWEKINYPLYWIKLRRWVNWPLVKQALRGGGLWCEDMSRAFKANKICLGLLNKRNRDLQTTRSLEIPACGGFMLAERSSEHEKLFTEGREAEYFDNLSELVSKIRYYLENEEERRAIAYLGYKRCLQSDYTYQDRAQSALEIFQSSQRE